VNRHEAGRFGVIAGEGRCKALKLLGRDKTYVRCLKGQFTSRQLDNIALIDNLLTDQSLRDPLMFGLACHDYMQRHGLSARELAKTLPNKDASTITRAVAIVRKLPADIHALMRSGQLPKEAATLLTSLPDDESKRSYARQFIENHMTAKELAAVLKAARNGTSAAAPGSFTCEHDGVRIVVTLPGQDLASAEAALRMALKDLREHGSLGLARFKDFLSKKAHATKKAAELQSAKDELART
jgi:ParB-like chromosome segregation protein Spo0J